MRFAHRLISLKLSAFVFCTIRMVSSFLQEWQQMPSVRQILSLVSCSPISCWDVAYTITRYHTYTVHTVKYCKIIFQHQSGANYVALEPRAAQNFPLSFLGLINFHIFSLCFMAFFRLMYCLPVPPLTNPPLLRELYQASRKGATFCWRLETCCNLRTYCIPRVKL